MNKDPKNCRTHRIRPIILFDIEVNMHNKHLGRISTRQAKTLDGIAPEQYGTQKEKSTEIQALNLILLSPYCSGATPLY